MSFRVSARTIIELGSELISSDGVALYELVKNAIDAKSDSGVDIRFIIALTKYDYLELQHQIKINNDENIEYLKKIISNSFIASYDEEQKQEIIDLIQSKRSTTGLLNALTEIYNEYNYIEISDTGCGMSMDDLHDVFLTIGTPKRFKDVQSALDSEGKRDIPLGEKGVGRLSTMRLGDYLHVETATKNDKHLNIVDIDWELFDKDPNLLVGDIPIEPYVGDKKEHSDYSGTVLRIYKLKETWTEKVVENIAQKDIARITDPFKVKGRRRFSVKIWFNDEEVLFVRSLNKAIKENTQASCIGMFDVLTNGDVILKLSMEYQYFNAKPKHENYKTEELIGFIKDEDFQVSQRMLRNLGPFSFDLNWFNRQRIKKPEGFDSVKEFKALVAQWSGIMMYRDGYQVLPYGNEDTDWLELDRKALASKGYKLNKAQFVGRICISRLKNPKLLDQTNREGLRECEEKSILINLLQFIIRDRFKEYLDAVDKASKQGNNDVDLKAISSDVENLFLRANKSAQAITKKDTRHLVLVNEINDAVLGLREKCEILSRRIVEMEGEQEQLIDLAGIGLMIESIAHELARAVENYHTFLKSKDGKKLPEDVSSFIRTTESLISAIYKRLKIIDPVSINARQRKKEFDLREVIETLIDAKQGQFERHNIKVFIYPKEIKAIKIKAVEGKIIQIIENLISNSVYWLDNRCEIRKKFQPKINITLSSNPIAVRFSDNGVGVAPERAEQVFQPFFSMKKETKRRGLGLFIARECAEYHGASLYMDEEALNNEGYLNTFILEFKSGK